jgi:hypothetical protein
VCISLNADEFMRVISNLLDNAVQAVDTYKGNIVISLKKNCHFLRLTIQDNGCGISNDNVRLILKEGVSFNRYGGSGLGLYYVKSIIDSMHGKITVKSEIGKGTVVKIDFPVSAPADWLAKKVLLNPAVYIIDNDQEVLKAFEKIFRKKGLKFRDIALKYFKKPENFLKTYNGEECTVFIGYIFSNSFYTGLTFLDEKKDNILGDIYLITNDYDSTDIQNKIVQMSLKMIPKPCLNALDIFRKERLDDESICCNPLF